MVTVTVVGAPVPDGPYGSTPCGTLPSGYEPVVMVHAACVKSNASGGGDTFLICHPDGSVEVTNQGGDINGTACYGTASWGV